MNNLEVQLRKGTWEEEEGEYHFPACDTSDRYITQFWPVRMKVQSTGDAAFILNRFVMT